MLKRRWDKTTLFIYQFFLLINIYSIQLNHFSNWTMCRTKMLLDKTTFPFQFQRIDELSDRLEASAAGEVIQDGSIKELEAKIIGRIKCNGCATEHSFADKFYTPECVKRISIESKAVGDAASEDAFTAQLNQHLG